MYRRIIFTFTIALLITAIWQVVNKQGNPTEQPEKDAVTAEDRQPFFKTAVSYEQREVTNLDPIHEVTVHRNIIYANKINETANVEPLKLDLYEPSDDKVAMDCPGRFSDG